MRTFPVTALTSAQLTPSSPAARPSAPAPAPRARPRRTGASARGAGVFRCSRTDTGRRLAPRASGGMLLWMSSGEFKIVWCGDELVELAGDVAFEAADDLLLGQAVFGASFHVGAGAGVPAQAADDDPVERFVGLSVAAAVEAVPVGLAGRGGDRRGTAEHRERRLRTQPVVVVAGGDQQLAGDVGADAVGGDQAGVD